jgi:hypothetical protein
MAWKKIAETVGVSACLVCGNPAFDFVPGADMDDPQALVRCGKCGHVCPCHSVHKGGHRIKRGHLKFKRDQSFQLYDGCYQRQTNPLLPRSTQYPEQHWFDVVHVRPDLVHPATRTMMSCLTLCGPIAGAAEHGSETSTANNIPTNSAPDAIIVNRSDTSTSLSKIVAR